MGMRAISTDKKFEVVVTNDKRKLPRERFFHIFINFIKHCKVYDDKVYYEKIKEEYDNSLIYYELIKKSYDMPLNDEEIHIFSKRFKVYNGYNYTNALIPQQYRPFLHISRIGIFPNLPIPKSMFFTVLKYVRNLYKEKFYDKKKNKDFFLWTLEHELFDFYGDDIMAAYEYLLETYKPDNRQPYS